MKALMSRFGSQTHMLIHVVGRCRRAWAPVHPGTDLELSGTDLIFVDFEPYFRKVVSELPYEL